MRGEPGVDYPDEREPVDVRAASLDETLLSFVHQVDEDGLLLTIGEDPSRRRVRLEPGELLELIWQGPSDMRTAPGELVGVRTGDRAHWEVRLTGPSASGQRRDAVRAPSTFPVVLRLDDVVVEATGIDLSEGGLRCTFPRGVLGGRPVPAEGTPLGVTVTLGPDVVECPAAVVRDRSGAGDRVDLAVRFVDLGERTEDLIRRHVFAELRELRARGVL